MLLFIWGSLPRMAGFQGKFYNENSQMTILYKIPNFLSKLGVNGFSGRGSYSTLMSLTASGAGMYPAKLHRNNNQNTEYKYTKN